MEYDPPSRSHEQATATLAGLKADLQILDKTGNVVLQEALTEDRFQSIESADRANAFRPMLYFQWVPPGDYQISLTVHEPAPSLTGVQHRIVARYAFCGIEYFPVAIAGAATIAGLLVGSILALAIAVVTWEKRSRAAISSGDRQ